jgi:hypothetical protein
VIVWRERLLLSGHLSGKRRPASYPPFPSPRATILTASSGNGLWSACASYHGACIQTSYSSAVVRITGMALGSTGDVESAAYAKETPRKGHSPSRRANHLSGFTRSHCTRAADGGRNRLREKTHFANNFNAERQASPSRQNFPISFLQKSCITPLIPPHRRGVRAVVTICEAGMRWTCWLAVYLLHGRTSRCGREVVWS